MRGGVGFYVTNNLDYTLLEEYSLMTETFESIFYRDQNTKQGKYHCWGALSSAKCEPC